MASKASTTQVHTVGAYRNNPAWATAHAAAGKAGVGNAPYMQAVVCITHLGWRTPKSVTSWHASTNATAKGHLQALGLWAPGIPLPQAMHVAVGAMVKHAANTAQKQHAAELLAMLPAK